MYDAHYDLLTVLYFRTKSTNKNKDIKKVVSDCMKIYNDRNIEGGIINLYFMSLDEMKEELDISSEECQNVPKMFQESIKILNKFKENKIIPEDSDFIYSIEGCDYIKDEKELEILYNLGLRSILPVWNERNKYGSGNRSESGLTDLGKVFIKKAIDLGIAIDLSHANEKTFYDIIEVVKEEQSLCKETIVLASHSNVKSICDIKRNLDDYQLKMLKEVGGYIGVLLHGGFITKNSNDLTIDGRKPYLINHLNYLIENIGFSEEKILIATDNMNYNPLPEYHNLEAFKIETVKEDLQAFLSKYYNDDLIYKLLQGNMQQLFHNIRDRNIHSKRNGL